VEVVEAFTIVLAVGVTRGWRSSLAGAILALILLVGLVALLGIAILQVVPLTTLRIIVGVFLLLFGLKWLRKAVLRYAGFKALHDEAETFREEVAELSGGVRKRSFFDGAALATSFNAVLLEGLEVVFIVLAIGAPAKATGSAAIGALAAAAIVVMAGFALRRPLERVPENTLKFIVGVMLTAFGTFWTAEGLGVKWWHSDLSLVPLIAGYLVASLILIRLLGMGRRDGPEKQPIVEPLA